MQLHTPVGKGFGVSGRGGSLGVIGGQGWHGTSTRRRHHHCSAQVRTSSCQGPSVPPTRSPSSGVAAANVRVSALTGGTGWCGCKCALSVYQVSSRGAVEKREDIGWLPILAWDIPEMTGHLHKSCAIPQWCSSGLFLFSPLRHGLEKGQLVVCCNPGCSQSYCTPRICLKVYGKTALLSSLTLHPYPTFLLCFLKTLRKWLDYSLERNLKVILHD